MNIGQASEASGISAKMIRYYEAIGLVPQVLRTEGGYRDYDTTAVHRLRFIRRSRDLGFSFEQIRELLKLWSGQKRSSADVRSLAQSHIVELEGRASELQEMIRTLKQLVKACSGNHRPSCPIIEELETGSRKTGGTTGCAGTSSAKGKKSATSSNSTTSNGRTKSW